MKKFLYFSAIIAIFLIPNTSRAMGCENYTDEEYKYIVEQSNPNDLDLTCANGTLYTDDYLNSIKRTTDEYSINPLKISDFLDVPHFTQERYYWCGPANIKQVLHYLNKSSLSQYQYSLDADTERYQETWVYKVVETLNKYLSGYTYMYELGSNYNIDGFMGLVTSSVMRRKPIILHALTKSLTMYNGVQLGHYITVDGYMGVEAITYTDTFYEDYGVGNVGGWHYDTIANVLNTVSDGSRYIIREVDV